MMVGRDVQFAVDLPALHAGQPLLQRLVRPGGLHLFAVDGVRLLHHFHLFGRHGANDANGQPRPRERLARNQPLGDAQLAPGLAHLVFEQIAQRLNNLFEIHAVRQAAHVVVAFNHRAFAAKAAFHHVRVDGALHQVIHRANAPGK